MALKFLRAAAHHRADLRRRFLREARAASSVDHPNVVTIHDVFEDDEGLPVIVMDLLEGQTLAERIAEAGALPLEEAATMMLPVISAVGAAHAVGVVHRDLKPDNVFLLAEGTDGERVRVLDFGIAKLTGGSEGTDDGVVTGTGALLGTPCYMSPEQGFGEKDVDHRADVWAIGVMLYEVLSGVRPIEGDNLGQVLKRLMNDGITPLEVLVPDLPSDITELVARLLRREREERPQDLREVLTVIAAHARGTAPTFSEPRTSMTSIPGELDSGSQHPLVVVGRPTTDPEDDTAAFLGGQRTLTPLDNTGASAADRSQRRRSQLMAVGVGLALAAAGIVAWSQSSTDAQKSPETASAALSPSAAGEVPSAAPEAEQAATAPDDSSSVPSEVASASVDAGAAGSAEAEPAPQVPAKAAPRAQARRRWRPAARRRTPPKPTPEPAPAPAPTPHTGGQRAAGGLVEDPPF